MARDAVTITSVTPAAGVDRPAGTTISVANGASIDVGGDTSDLLILVTNTVTTPAHDITIQSGANPPALSAGLGDRVEECNAAEQWFVVDGSRHVQADGKIYLDFETNFTGKVLAARLSGV